MAELEMILTLPDLLYQQCVVRVVVEISVFATRKDGMTLPLYAINISVEVVNHVWGTAHHAALMIRFHKYSYKAS